VLAWICPVFSSYCACPPVAQLPPAAPPPEQFEFAVPVCEPSGDTADTTVFAWKLVEQVPVPEHPAEDTAWSAPTSTVANDPHDPREPPPEHVEWASAWLPPTVWAASAREEYDAEQFEPPEHPAAAFAYPLPAVAWAYADPPPPPGPLPPPEPCA
jgi:hypothetical protein